MRVNNNNDLYSLLKSCTTAFNLKRQRQQKTSSHIKSSTASSNLNSRHQQKISSGTSSLNNCTASYEGMISSKIQGLDVKKLSAANGTLNFESGSIYKYQTKSGRTVILTGSSSGTVYMPFSELKIADGIFQPSEYGEIDRVEKFFTFLLSSKNGYGVRTYYSPAETKDMLARVGIEPGWFEINCGVKSNKFYMLEDGTIYPEYQVEAQRNALNANNWLKEGYEKDSVFIIDGKEYELDDSGHLNIPEGTACLYEIIKMKNGRIATISASADGTVYTPCSEQEINGIGSKVGVKKRVQDFFTFLLYDSTGTSISSRYTKADTKEILASAGIKQGWFEIKCGEMSNRFYVQDDGTISSDNQMGAQI